ncbi:MAG TPA: hypothetical protein VF883_14645 [Thermoanaerobaculia bacterium]|jgi:hypothetical protein
MTDVTLHPAPRWRDVVLQQVAIVGLSLRREALVVAAVLAAGTALIGGDIISGGPGFDSDETFPTALIAFLYPFLVWRSEKRFGPAFLWTLPVDRRRLALAKVFAGWVWFMVALTFFVAWLLALGLLAGAPAARTIMRVPFTATVGAYLFGSALVLGLRHPLRWLLGAAGVLVLMGSLGDVISQPDDSEWQYVPGARAFFSTTDRLVAVWVTLPDSAQWAITALLWFGGGLIALWIAASRHRERQRR